MSALHYKMRGVWKASPGWSRHRDFRVNCLSAGKKKMDLSPFPVVVHRNYHLQPLLN